MDTFGQKIKYLRQERNLTQKSLAEKLSITVSTLSHWECNYQEPSFDDLCKLCAFFDVEADFLIGIKSEIANFPLKNEKLAPTLSQDEQELLDIYHALAREYKAQILEYARYFASRRGIKIKNN